MVRLLKICVICCDEWTESKKGVCVVWKVFFFFVFSMNVLCEKNFTYLLTVNSLKFKLFILMEKIIMYIFCIYKAEFYNEKHVWNLYYMPVNLNCIFVEPISAFKSNTAEAYVYRSLLRVLFVCVFEWEQFWKISFLKGIQKFFTDQKRSEINIQLNDIH